MKITTMKTFTLLISAVLTVPHLLANEAVDTPLPNVVIQAMAEGEVQPQLLKDKQGRIHLVYFKVENIKTKMGNLFYKHYKYDKKSWSEAIQISQKAYRLPDVIATAKLAVDAQGRVHVTWLEHKPTAYLYSRSDSMVKSFSPERSLVTQYLEGAEASAVISTHENTVTLSWMAGWDENLRTVYSITSNDNGATFGDEVMIGDQSIGGCACCGYASHYNNQGELLVAYRSATNGNGRHMQLLSLKGDQKQTWLVDPWEYSSCPVSTNDMVQDNNGNIWLTWETAGEIYASQVQDKVTKPFLVSTAKQEIRQKHPTMKINNSQYKLIAWSEGNGYFSGGELKLQLYDPESKAVDAPSTKDMQLQNYSAAAVIALADDSFLVLY